jgi:hypothetical protein
MDFYYRGWVGFVSIQNLYRSVAPHRILMVRKLFSPGLFYGVLLALGLSFVWAQYLSASMFSFYHDWSGWRTITGGAPNQITHGLEKISWAVIFCSCWWMLWRLDLFISQLPKPKETDEKARGPQKEEEEPKAKEPAFTHTSENFEPEVDDMEDEQAENHAQSQKTEQAQKFTFPTIEEVQMAEVLGLNKEDLNDFSKIKSTYRTAIAQYHPDKVSALGLEIREVAEKKAKEINQAYEFFRKKFKDQ